MDSLVKVLRWVVTALVILFLVGLGLRVARAFLGLAVLVGIGVVLWVLFGTSTRKRPRGAG